MNEAQIEREIKQAFDDQDLKVEFYKYWLDYDVKSHCRHLECISLLFSSAQQAQENLMAYLEIVGENADDLPLTWRDGREAGRAVSSLTAKKIAAFD